jgi:hypothetical protein
MTELDPRLHAWEPFVVGDEIVGTTCTRCKVVTRLDGRVLESQVNLPDFVPGSRDPNHRPSHLLPCDEELVYQAELARLRALTYGAAQP